MPCLPSAALAADRSAVTTLKPGGAVKIRPHTGRQIGGNLTSATSERVCVSRSGGETCFDRAGVQRLRVRSGKARARNTSITAGVTAGIWTTFVLIAFGESSDADAVPEVAFFGSLLLGGVGGGIAALFPGYSTMYEVP